MASIADWYTALVFGQRCRLARIDVSMAPRAIASITRSARASTPRSKKELLHRRSWPTKAEARNAVFECIETFYNQRRRHSTLGYIAPALYDAKYQELARQTEQEEQEAA